MDGSYRVVADALTNHARTLSGLAGELGAAVDAAGASGMTADAYGRVGQKFAASLDALARAGQDALRAGVEAFEWAGTTMRETADAYARDDADGAERFFGLDGEIA